MAEPSRELIARAQQGEPQALSQLVLSQQHYIYSIAMSVLKHPEDAADLTQEAFIRLFRALPQYNGESRFTTWLYRLVVNLGLDQLRRRGRTVSLDEVESAGDLMPSTNRFGDPEAAAVHQDSAARVRGALERLPLGQRLALTLLYFEDVRYEEVAEIMSLPLNTVKSHIRRGRERLARELADLGPATSARAPEASP